MYGSWSLMGFHSRLPPVLRTLLLWGTIVLVSGTEVLRQQVAERLQLLYGGKTVCAWQDTV